MTGTRQLRYTELARANTPRSASLNSASQHRVPNRGCGLALNAWPRFQAWAVWGRRQRLLAADLAVGMVTRACLSTKPFLRAVQPSTRQVTSPKPWACQSAVERNESRNILPGRPECPSGDSASHLSRLPVAVKSA